MRIETDFMTEIQKKDLSELSIVPHGEVKINLTHTRDKRLNIRYPRFDITNEQIDRAKNDRWDKRIAFANDADLNADRWFIGRLGEEVFSSVFPEAKFLNIAAKTGDFIWRGLRIDVKTSTISGPANDRLHAFIAKKDEKKSPQVYMFMMISKDLKFAWIAGAITYSRYFKESKLMLGPSRWSKIDCHILTIDKLTPFAEFVRFRRNV